MSIKQLLIDGCCGQACQTPHCMLAGSFVGYMSADAIGQLLDCAPPYPLLKVPPGGHRPNNDETSNLHML